MANFSHVQTEGIEQINTGIEQISTVTQQNSAVAEQSAATAEQMSAQSVALDAMTKKFRIKKPSYVHDHTTFMQSNVKAGLSTGNNSDYVPEKAAKPTIHLDKY